MSLRADTTNSSQRPVEEAKLPRKIQIELIRVESDDRRDKRTCPWDAIRQAWAPPQSRNISFKSVQY
jgi:hypothetical protein